jgi:LPXTG-motif cell wall-anchored protein
MLLAAIMAMVLAAAAPAFAQATVDLDDDAGDTQYEQGQQNDQNTVVQDSICVNVQQAAANQYNAGDQAAGAEGGDVIGDTNAAGGASNIANALGLTTAQVNACLNDFESASPAASPVPTGTASPDASVPAGGGGGGGGGTATAAAGSASAAAGGELPATGGSSLLALGAGALLVAGGLLARRIVR